MSAGKTDITVSLPTAVIPRVLNAFAAQYGWTADSGVTKAQFAKRQIGRYVRDVVAGYEAGIAAETARSAAVAKAVADLGDDDE